MSARTYPGYGRITRKRIRATMRQLRQRQDARRAGHPVYLTSDPAWLVDMAINRRAGWVEDPHAHGSVNAPRLGRYMTGDAQRHLRLIANVVNTPRLIARPAYFGTWRAYLEARIPERLTDTCD